MPINGLSVGIDVKVDVVTQFGIFTIRGKTSFEAKPRYHEREHIALDGNNLHLPIPAGWEGEIDVDRQDGSLDNFFATSEALYYAGVPVQPATITETITNPDLTISQFQYIQATLMLKEGGHWKGDDKVVQKIGWRASRRNELI